MDRNDVFRPVITEMKDTNTNIYGPSSFLDYLKANNLPRVRTPEYLSIDSFDRLPAILRDNDTMILRLGSSLDSNQTNFALIKVKNKLHDFFLFDDEIFNYSDVHTFLPTTSIKKLFGYYILSKKFTETSLVNLALASGILNYALELPEGKIPLAPATGKSTFTFEFYPHSDVDQILLHNKGQVEIDAMFVENRNDRETLFILEAKGGDKHRSLAKHKLVYPILSIAKYAPMDMPIVPIYLKIFKNPNGIHFHIVECKFPNPRDKLRALNDLAVRNYTHLNLPLFMEFSR